MVAKGYKSAHDKGSSAEKKSKKMQRFKLKVAKRMKRNRKKEERRKDRSRRRSPRRMSEKNMKGRIARIAAGVSTA